MSTPAPSESRLSTPDSRPLVVTVIVVGYLLMCSWGALNAVVLLVNGSSRVVLSESPHGSTIERSMETGELSGFRPAPTPPEDPPDPALAKLERIASLGFLLVALAGIGGACALYKRHTWSRVHLWMTTVAIIGGYAAYHLIRLRIETAPILDEIERAAVFQFAVSFALLNVAIQAIPLAILAGLLRHSAVQAYLKLPGPKKGKKGDGGII
jgi:hypothetical protein